MDRKILLVTGLPRGGTSMAAVVAHELGISMFLPGEDVSAAPDVAHRYPYGNCEDRLFRRLVWEAIDCEPFENGVSGWSRRIQRALFRPDELDAFTAWLDARLAAADGEWIGVKLPALVFVMRPLVNFLRWRGVEPRVLVVERSMEKAVSSMAAKRGQDHCPEAPWEWAHAVQSHNRWMLTRAIHDASSLDVPVRSIQWTILAEKPGMAVAEIADFCGVDRLAKAAKVIDTALHAA
jgi:hypothetical protein